MTLSTDSACAPNLFQGASNSHIHDSTIIAVAGSYITTSDRENNFEIDRLIVSEVAPHAILNAGGRADAVGCHPGTREEIISKIEQWMASGYSTDRGILWLSGPAGAGKSAIVQTIADRCVQRRVLMANFFFFRGDPSRNSARRLVGTLVHQLIQLFPELRHIIEDILRQNRLVFRKSLRDQFMELIDGPVRSVLRASPNDSPIVLLLDGLDECESRYEPDHIGKTEQAALVNVLHTLASPPDSPFIVLVASRTERHIEMAFNAIGISASSILLNEMYRPENDICLFVTAELARIKATHPLAHLLDAQWPTTSMIECIVSNSSGQFIYAATVLRFIANSTSSPALTMQMVLGVRPVQKRSPFAEIDAIYSYVLSQAEHWDDVRNVLALHTMVERTRHASYSLKFDDNGQECYTRLSRTTLAILGYSEHEVVSFFFRPGVYHGSPSFLFLRYPFLSRIIP